MYIRRNCLFDLATENNVFLYRFLAAIEVKSESHERYMFVIFVCDKNRDG